MHSLVDMFRARMFAICCGYEDADDLDHLRSDPAFKLAADGCRTAAPICVPSQPCRGCLAVTLIAIAKGERGLAETHGSAAEWLRPSAALKRSHLLVFLLVYEKSTRS